MNITKKKVNLNISGITTFHINLSYLRENTQRIMDKLPDIDDKIFMGEVYRLLSQLEKISISWFQVRCPLFECRACSSSYCMCIVDTAPHPYSPSIHSAILSPLRSSWQLRRLADDLQFRLFPKISFGHLSSSTAPGICSEYFLLRITGKCHLPLNKFRTFAEILSCLLVIT